MRRISEKPLLTIIVSMLASILSMRFQKIWCTDSVIPKKEECVKEATVFGVSSGVAMRFPG